MSTNQADERRVTVDQSDVYLNIFKLSSICSDEAVVQGENVTSSDPVRFSFTKLLLITEQVYKDSTKTHPSVVCCCSYKA